jgi:hypothetical protein
MSSPSVPISASNRVKLIRRLLYGALLGGVIALAFSLPIFFGFLSLLTTPIMFGLTLIFTLTLLITSAQNLSGTRPPAGRHTLPVLCRKPTIVAAYVMGVGWFGVIVALAYMQVEYWRWEPGEEEWRMRRLGVGEAIVAVGNVGIFLVIGVLCGRERREVIGRRQGGGSKRALRFRVKGGRFERT